MQKTELTITRLGHRGDGIADADDGPVYVSGALPGESVLVTVAGGRGQVADIVTSSPDRITPACAHYERCGGCAVQHLAPKPYLAWKRDLVAWALADRGIETDIADPLPSPVGSRRRTVLTAMRAGRHVLLGYHEKGSNRLVDIRECPVLDPSITAALPGLRQLAALVMPKKGDLRMTVLTTAAGLDVALEKADKNYVRAIPALSQKTMDLDLARLAVNGETILQLRPPVLDMDGIPVVPAPAGFVQATRDAEMALAQLVQQGIDKSKTVADLFAGAGTFALRLARHFNVHAVEGDAAALQALDAASRKVSGLKRLTTERRDLFRRPLVPQELEKFDAVVFDPPRAGAQAQSEHLAMSKVKTIVAVSCNPATLARDLRILLDGGYTIDTITPVDQFLFSPHIEVVAVLTRE